MNKSIVIGLGGTGTYVVELLRKRLEIYTGTDSPPECRFIYVDTDAQNSAVRDTRTSELCKMTMDTPTVALCKDPDSRLARRIGLSSWMERSRLAALSPLSAGADGVRAYGRLALLAGADLAKLIGLLETSIAQLLAGSSPGSGQGLTTAALRVFVISSAGGGSGSGFFIDMGYLTRLLLPPSGHYEQVGIVAVAPSTFQLDRAAPPGTRQNSAALLDELDHFTRANSIFRANYNERELPEVIGKDRPYQFCYIVSPMVGHGALRQTANESVELMQQRMADMVFIRLTGPDQIGSRQSDFNKDFENKPEDMKGYPNAFCTFGVSLRQFPARKYFDESIGKAMVKVANRWLKTGVSTAQLTALAHSAYTDLYDQLGLPPTHIVTGKTPRDMDSDRLYLSLIATTQTQLRDILRDAKTPTELDNLFSYQPGAPVSVASGGYIAGTIHNNRDNASRQLCESMRQAINALLFDLDFGPPVALNLMNALNQSIEEEQKFIRECRQKLAMPTAQVTVTTTPTRDPLLGPWQGDLKRSRVSVAPQLAGEKNRRMEAAILDAKALVLKEMTQEMDSLSPRVEQLENFITAWRNKWSKLTSNSWRNALPANVILADSIVEAKIDRFTVAPKPQALDPIRVAYDAPGFPTELPKTVEGALDDTAFAQIEATIERSLAATYDATGQPIPATDTILGESVVRVIGEQNQGQWQGAAKAMVEDAWPLLILNLNDTDYAHLLPPNPAGFPNKVEYYWFINRGDAHPASHNRLQKQILDDYTNANDAGGVPIRRDIEPWDREIEPALASIVYLRGAFPTRIIAGLGQEDRQRLLGEAASTYYARADVLSPITPEERQQAEARLLLLEAMKLDQCLPPGLTISVDGEHYSITYQDTTSAFNGLIDAKRREIAIHKLAVYRTLSSKIDEAVSAHCANSVNRGEVVAALAKLRSMLNVQSVNANAPSPGLTWPLLPSDGLVILGRIDIQYRLDLTVPEVQEARKLLLTILTLRNIDAQNDLLRYQTTAQEHEFTYNDTRSGIRQPRTIALSKKDPNVAARTLAANTAARDAVMVVWHELQNRTGGTGEIQNALVEMINTLDNLSVNAYCKQMDMFGLEPATDRELLCEVAQDVLDDNVHPWAVKNEDQNSKDYLTWKCRFCGWGYGPQKPALSARCDNPGHVAAVGSR